MHWNQWTFMDFVFAAVILVSTGVAVWKGLAREVISLVALIGGFLLAAFYYRTCAGWFMGFFRTESIAHLVSFILIFTGCLLVGAVIAFIVNRFLKMASLKWIDRLMGGVFGFLRGWAVASILVLAFIAFPVGQNAPVASALAPYLLAGARAAVVMVPQELKLKFNEHYQKILQTWNDHRSPV